MRVPVIKQEVSDTLTINSLSLPDSIGESMFFQHQVLDCPVKPDND